MKYKYYFFKKDFQALVKLIEDIKQDVRDAGAEMGLACQEGAETFHDNFAYEDSERRQVWLTRRMVDLNKIKNYAVVIETQPNQGRVAMGRTITIEDDETGEQQTFFISSYMAFEKETETGIKIISYDAPLAKALIGKFIDDSGRCVVRGQTKSYTIVKIE